LVHVDDEPAKKGKRVKRPAKKSTTTPEAGIFISESPVEIQSKRKEKVTHPSGSGKVAEKPPSVEKINSTVTREGIGDKPGVPDVTKDDSTESETESWGNDKDDKNDENDLESEGNDEENKSDDDKTPFVNENGSDFKQDTNGSESDSESDRQEDEEEVKDDDEEEDEFAHTPPNIDDKEDANLESKSDDKIEYVASSKGIKLLSEVALAKKAQTKEVRKKSLREFHRTRPSGSGMIAETPPSVEKTKSLVISDGTGDKPRVSDVTKDDSTESESES
nr:hypothetical protein [Tanacetum cinerariifolium]